MVEGGRREQAVEERAVRRPYYTASLTRSAVTQRPAFPGPVPTPSASSFCPRNTQPPAQPPAPYWLPPPLRRCVVVLRLGRQLRFRLQS